MARPSVVLGPQAPLRPHLVGALDHVTGVVLGRNAVAEKSNEIPAVRDLLAVLDPDDLRGCVITVDAMHIQIDTAVAIIDAGADYVLTVKDNQSSLHQGWHDLPWKKVPTGSQTAQRGHDRQVTRTLKAVDVPAWITFSGAAQVAQVRRAVTSKGKKISKDKKISKGKKTTNRVRCASP